MAIKVTLHYDPVWTALTWAKQHCPSYITNDTHIDESGRGRIDMIDYFFGDQGDAVKFILKWS